MVVNVWICRVQLGGEAKVCKAKGRIILGILALLDEEAGALDQSIHSNLSLVDSRHD